MSIVISHHRFIAVTRPIQYAKHKGNNKRVAFTIAIVWVISVAIGSPIVLGLNTSQERTPQLCIFYNSDFIIYSSLGSFYIPCVLMVFLYYRIFKAIHDRAKKPIGSGKPVASAKSASKSALVIENISQTSRLKSDSPDMDSASQQRNTKIIDKIKKQLPLITETEPATNTGSDEQDDFEADSDAERVECQIIKNAGASSEPDQFTVNLNIPERLTPTPNTEPDNTTTSATNGNPDSGYATTAAESEIHFSLRLRNPSITAGSPGDEFDVDIPAGPMRPNNGAASTGLARSTSVSASAESTTAVVEEKKRSRFNLGRKHKSSKKKRVGREKASAKRERKATKTLAIVLGKRVLSSHSTRFATLQLSEGDCHIRQKCITQGGEIGFSSFLIMVLNLYFAKKSLVKLSDRR